MNVAQASRDLDLLDPDFRKKVDLFLQEVGDKIFITEAYRSQERQEYLYSFGRTRKGKKVTWTLDSMHTKGLAIDIAFKGNDLYPKSMYKWAEIGEIANKYEIDWGYDLWETDKPHFQDNGKTLKMKDYETLQRENEILRRRSDEVDELLNQALKANKPNKYDS